MYPVLRSAQHRFLPLRHHRYHLRQWGTFHPDQPPLVLLHGWMDVSASWQFVVDALQHERCIVAPDWRGFGLTRPLHADPTTPWGTQDHYLFADYLGDLDFLLDALNASWQRPADAPFDLVGHSMGGNVGMFYSGVRPHRVRRLVNLEGFGMPATRPEEAPARYAQWMDQLKQRHQGTLDLHSYDNSDRVARRLCKTNPRLREDRAQWLAQQWAQPDAEGRWHIQGDPSHKVVSAMLYRVDEAQALFSAITAPVLVVEAQDNLLDARQGSYTLADFHRRLSVVPHCHTTVVANAGHMLHHDQPEAVARLIEQHLA